MSDAATAKFSCDACGKQYTWKPELAGKKAKCKCGGVMMVPSDPPMALEQDGLYDLAPDAAPKPKAKPKAPLAPLTPRNTGGGTRSEGLRPVAAAVGAGGGGGPIPAAVGYQSGPTQREKDRFSSDTLVDKKRDLYVPLGLLVAGFVLFMVGYSVRHHVYGGDLAGVAVGLGIMTVVSAVLLIGIALAIAGPMGVSFGEPLSAALKLAALAVFCDGVLTWIEFVMVKLAGPGGAMYGTIFNFFAAAGIFWILLMYLFSMESEDSWLVVCLLSFFYVLARWVVVFLFATMLNLGGMAGGGGRSAASSGVKAADAEMADHLDILRDANSLPEAKEYIAGGRLTVMTDHVNAMYEAGAKKIWFECSRDINAKLTPEDLVVELPSDKSKRGAVLKKIGEYYKAFDMGDGTPPADNGQTYLQVAIPN